jgi:hypothetical protein
LLSPFNDTARKFMSKWAIKYRLNIGATWFWTSQAPELWIINFFYLLLKDILLQEPELTKSYYIKESSVWQ